MRLQLSQPVPVQPENRIWLRALAGLGPPCHRCTDGTYMTCSATRAGATPVAFPAYRR